MKLIGKKLSLTSFASADGKKKEEHRSSF